MALQTTLEPEEREPPIAIMALSPIGASAPPIRVACFCKLGVIPIYFRRLNVVNIVSKRYHLSMMNTPKISDHAIAELIYQLGRIVQGEGFVAGLTPAQWTALRYFARANRFSRMVSAFADFHATTRGTASQTVKSLVMRGCLTRIRSSKDGRSASLNVTAKGREALADDPFESLVRAVGDVSPGGRRHLATGLKLVLGHIAREQGKRPFGCCPACQHLEGEGSGRQGQAPYACGLMAESLSEQELGEICVNFEPDQASAMSRAR